MTWKDEDILAISGLQHFAFCRRQWALIHIEHQWADNFLTTDGSLMHERAHNRECEELRNDTLTVRAMPVQSNRLGISGVCDVVEFYRSPDGITLTGREGTWLPHPVEYKRGKPGCHTYADKLQLCAQAMCLEEMLLCPMITEAAIYYGETRHRQAVELDSALRDDVSSMVSEMHKLWDQQYTPKVKSQKGCSSCSLRDLCIPRLQRSPLASTYIRMHLEETE